MPWPNPMNLSAVELGVSPAQLASFRAYVADQSRPTPALLALVNNCPDRGGVLPISMQREGCSNCGELSACNRGLGAIPGRVTLRDCLDCRRGA